MSRRGVALAAAVFLPFLFLAAEAPQVQVPDAGFEQQGLGSWQAAAASGAVTVDDDAPRSGQACLKIAHRAPARSSVYSAPLRLRVGQFYRLRAWVRTADAFSDPEGRYPTPVAACLSMDSFPFTNHSPAAGATRGWHELQVVFVATQEQDRVGLHLGYNGDARGEAWFDDVRLEEVSDITEVVAPQTIRRHGPAFRFSDRGWTFLHVEGKPYERGVQHGTLMAEEMAAYMEKLANLQNPAAPDRGWAALRLLTDALMLRGFDEEYLQEMRGMADGMNARGVRMRHKAEAIDLLDVAAVNSAVDLGQLDSALARTATPLSGQSFPPADEERLRERLHKCSAVLANRSATRDGGIVFFQMFMWNGYTGVQFNVMCDVVPERGRRLVYETFPGGIHSGTDFYLNDAGIMIGETTTQQSPFAAGGTPQSNRIRKAAQYAGSIDEVVRILTTGNNGLYTNDWLIGDAGRNEIAVLLLGTKKHKLWRGSANDFPGGTTDFYWCVNNARDPEVRKEFVPDPQNAPYDLAFSPSNRDIAMNDFFRRQRGKIDARSAIGLMASSPINRPHACDGKITTGEMAREMVFMAHFGKTTLREKFPGETPRMPLLPDAVPHLTLGYTAFSPRVLTAKIQALPPAPAADAAPLPEELADAAEVYAFPAQGLWSNTVYPAGEEENWFVSASAAYYRLLKGLPADGRAAAPYLRDALAEMNDRLLFLRQNDGELAPLRAARRYDTYSHYQVPRIRGTFLLHQLRLAMGNEAFARLLQAVHGRFAGKPLSNAQFAAALEAAAPGQGLREVADQWLRRGDLPEPAVTARAEAAGGKWRVTLELAQPAERAWRFWTTVRIDTEKGAVWKRLEAGRETRRAEWTLDSRPRRLVFNAGNDIPAAHERFYTHANFADNFAATRLVYGSGRQIEAMRTLGLRWRTALADAFSEVLPPLQQDAEVTRGELEGSHLMLLGGAEDNQLTKEAAAQLGLTLGRDWFAWDGRVYGRENDGLLAVFPSPYNPRRSVTLIVANSALQLYQMTRAYQPLPCWAVFRGAEVVARGYHSPAAFTLPLGE
ncbi:MAG TPA: C45 family autoproteolytic acyltransferase/hydrolase [Candidatus Aminicenantes bacterium]|nr:C45 family autoproteolytic acyltransferase/hydrolase [Candidatus Aminicenantes bacterium]